MGICAHIMWNARDSIGGDELFDSFVADIHQMWSREALPFNEV